MLLLLSALAMAQDPHDTWSTATTEHFRVHYPQGAEAWSLHCADQLEEIRDLVSAEVGYEPDQVVDIVVQDPFARANGFAISHQRMPRMSIFSSPPESDSVLGNYSSWEGLLLVHEDTHLVHLLRPSRNPAAHVVFDQLLSSGPLSRKSTRWVAEGYATVIEGRITGSGRPNAAMPATWLRTMALEGRFPAYDDLDGSAAWGGGSYAYLVGSEFLMWLERDYGEQALRDLWTALSARKARSLEEGFVAVFGAEPHVLYEQFTVELTAASVAAEAEHGRTADTLWQPLSGYTGAPALSPDGTQMAVLVAHEFGMPELVIWDVADDPEVQQAWADDVAETLEKDPVDITPLAPKTWEKVAVHSLRRGDLVPEEVQWLPDGSGVVFSSWSAQADGFVRPDLYRWTFGERVERLTTGAALKDVSMHPDGTRAVAIHQLWGASGLVEVDVVTGEITPLEPDSIDVIWDDPRWSPDGTRVAALRNVDGWEVVLLGEHATRPLPLPEGFQPSQIEWLPDGMGLVASVGVGDFVEAWILPLDGAPVQLTQTRGGAFAPVMSPDGELFYLSMTTDGLQLHRDRPTPWRATSRAVPAAMEGFDVSPEPTSVGEVWRLGPQTVRPSVGGIAGSGDEASLEAGVRVADLAGRSELFVRGAWGENLVTGGSASWAWRRLPWADVRTDAFVFTESPLGDRAGLAVALQGGEQWTTGAVRTQAGLVADVAPLSDASSRVLLHGGSSAAHRVWFGRTWLSGGLRGHGSAGLTAGAPALVGHGAVDLGLGFSAVGLSGGYGWLAARSDDPLDQPTAGGLQLSMMPPGWAMAQLRNPAFAYDALSAPTIEHSWAALGAEGAGLRADRLRNGDTATTSVSAQVNVFTERQPILGLPSAHVQIGLACVLETGDEGVRTKACRKSDHYRGWLGLSWTPDR